MDKKLVYYGILLISHNVDRHFSRTNQLLEQRSIAPIDWQL